MARNEQVEVGPKGVGPKDEKTAERKGEKAAERKAEPRQGAGRDESALSRQPLRGDVVRRGGGPFSLLERMFADVDRLFSRELGLPLAGTPFVGSPARWAGGLTEWAPQIEVFEREGHLIVRADLPGVKQEDVKVRIEDDVLLLSGERRNERTEEGEGFWRSERSYGRFERSIPLPPNVDAGRCDARFADGVLEIDLQLPEQPSSGRDIPIGAGSGAGTKSQPSGQGPGGSAPGKSAS